MKHLYRYLLGALCAISTFLASAQELVPKHNQYGKFGYAISGQSDFIIKPQWDEARQFNEYGVAIVRNGKKFGVIDKNGKYVNGGLSYSVIAPYDSTDLLIVAKGGKYEEKASKIKNRQTIKEGFGGSTVYPIAKAQWGLMRHDGSFVIEPKYQEIGKAVHQSAAKVQYGGNFGVISLKGKEILPPKYTVYDINNQGLVKYYNKSVIGVINSDGKVLAEEKNASYVDFMMFENNVDGSCPDAKLYSKQDWSDSKHPYFCYTYRDKNRPVAIVYDLNGNVVVPEAASLGSVNTPSEGVAIGVRYFDYNKKSKEWSTERGIYDLATKNWTQLKPEKYTPFKQGHSLTCKNSCYLVDKSGKRTSEVYKSAFIFDKNYVVVKDGKRGLTDLAGNVLLPLKYNSILLNSNLNLFSLKTENGKHGYADEKGKIIIPVEYDSCLTKGKYVVLGKSDLFGVSDAKNKNYSACKV